MVTVVLIILILFCCSIGTSTVSSRNNVCMLADRTMACCAGYYEEDGVCHECIGGYGFNCSYPCPSEWFGPRCKIRCQCAYSKCNAIYGCADGTNESENRAVSLDINFTKYPVSDVPRSRGNKFLNFIQNHWVVIFVVVILVLLVIVCSVAAVRSGNRGKRKKQQTNESYISYSLPETEGYNYQNLTPHASTEFLSVSFQSKPTDYINLHI